MDEVLKYFNSIIRFFMLLLVFSIVIFVITFMSLNNSIIERRKNELQLYNIFGSSLNQITMQTALEKLAMLLLSLIVSVPMTLYLVRVTSKVLSKITKYSLGEIDGLDSLFISVDREVGYKLYELVESGTDSIDVGVFIPIISTIGLMVVVIILLSIIQVRVNKKSILEQVRGE